MDRRFEFHSHHLTSRTMAETYGAGALAEPCRGRFRRRLEKGQFRPASGRITTGYPLPKDALVGFSCVDHGSELKVFDVTARRIQPPFAAAPLLRTC